MAGAVAVCHFHPRRRQDHLARLAAVQPVAQRHSGKRFLSLAGLHVQAHSFRPAGSAAHPHPVLSVFETRWKKTRRPARTNGAWISGRSSPITAISTATAACKSSRRSNRLCRTIAASNATGRRSGRSGVRKTIRKPARAASRCYGIYIATNSTRASKKCSLLFGLFQYQSDAEMKRLRLFYIPVFKSHRTSRQAEQIVIDYVSKHR